MLPLGAHRGARRTSLVLLQLIVFVTYIFGPTATFAEDPPEPTPTESTAPEPMEAPAPSLEPAPSTAPEPTTAPAPSTEPEPEPTAAPSTEPEPEPTAAPSTEPEPEPTAEPEPEPTTAPDDPDPTADPTAAPESNTRPYVITYVPGTSEARQLEILADAAATDVSAIPQLTMRSILLSEASHADQIATLRANPEVDRVDLDREREAGAESSDPAFTEQWALGQIGWTDLYGGVAAPGGSTVVAILDTGVDASHPELDGVLLPGVSFVDGSDANTDPNGHGTWMAGIVAAETNNGIGIAGAAWAGVSVLPITVLGADGLGQDSDIIAGVVHAADAGADVILMAFSNPGYSTPLQAAIDQGVRREHGRRCPDPHAQRRGFG